MVTTKLQGIGGRMLISLKEFADKHGIALDTARQGVLRGRYKTARKIGRNWVIEDTQLHIDNRFKKKGD